MPNYPWPAGHLTSHRVRIGNRNGTVETFGPGSQGLIPRMAYFIRFQSRKGETKDKATGVDDCIELDEANTATAAADFISSCQRRAHNEGEDRESHSPTSDSDSGTDGGEESEASSSEVEQIETPPKDRAYGDPQRRLDRLIDSSVARVLAENLISPHPRSRRNSSFPSPKIFVIQDLKPNRSALQGASSKEKAHLSLTLLPGRARR